MRIFAIAVGALFAAILGFAGLIFAASELGGEGVTLYTTDASGAEHETPLWVVELDGAQYLRAGDGASAWLARLRVIPDVKVERGGEVKRYRAIPEPEQVAAVDTLMAEKYGVADRIVDIMRDPANSVAVRLEPVAP
jgi:hypothetical protein